MAGHETTTVEGGATTTLEMDCFYLNQLPDAMEKMGWVVAPKLMRHWFSQSPAHAFSEAEKKEYTQGSEPTKIPKNLVNTDIVKMEWAITYPRVQDEINELMKTWNSDAGIDLLKKRLQKSNSIGYSNNTIELDELAQVNFKKIGSKWDDLDDFYGAIGIGTLKIAVRGKKDSISNIFITDKVGFYIKDTYDFFEGGEFLGVWSKHGVLTKTQTFFYMSTYLEQNWVTLCTEGYEGYVPIHNSDFHTWQKKHNQGVDFVVFSDVMWLDPLPQHRMITL